jgi:hypothetical protein
MKRTSCLGTVAVSASLVFGVDAMAQSTIKPPSLLQQGATAAMYGRCETDVLDGDLQRSAAVLGALAPAVVNRVVRDADELAQIALMCSLQIHQQRCTAKVVAVAGDVLLSQQPVGKASPPPPNPGALLGGTVGGLTGLLLGTSREGVGTGIGAAAIGGYLGAQGGSAAWNKAQMKSCIDRQASLDALSNKLQGLVTTLSVNNLTALIDANIRARTLTTQEATTLVNEMNKLADRAVEVLQAAR